MSSEEYLAVSRSLSELSSRVGQLEADVSALRGGVAAPPAPPPPRTYTVVSGDTLSGIAARLGLGDWGRLYEVNRGVIGPDPNRIYPGQVLVLP
jgi:nucleoid-associated protein YgaU